MNFGQALKALTDGKAVQRKAWVDHPAAVVTDYIHVTLDDTIPGLDPVFIVHTGVSKSVCNFTHADLLAEDWQILPVY